MEKILSRIFTCCSYAPKNLVPDSGQRWKRWPSDSCPRRLSRVSRFERSACRREGNPPWFQLHRSGSSAGSQRGRRRCFAVLEASASGQNSDCSNSRRSSSLTGISKCFQLGRVRKVCLLGSNPKPPTVSFTPPVANMKKWSCYRRRFSDHRQVATTSMNSKPTESAARKTPPEYSVSRACARRCFGHRARFLRRNCQGRRGGGDKSGKAAER